MNFSRRALCLFIALMFILISGAAALEFFAGEDDGVIDSEVADDGLVRVYLKSLNDPQCLYITLAGEYVIEETNAFRFERGAELIITADGDNALITVGAVTLNMGSSFTLTRCKSVAGEENGMYIYESERDALYEGDLFVGCADNALHPVLSIGIEDYLCGVVAYEMSDSFPLESLKAQVVAARTYAMNRKIARAGSDYDVTDTTSDQVFKGYISEYSNVIEAVAATKGVVGMYNGAYASCYYTASNGGQVATPGQIWGGDGDYGYIEQKDDPYDLENSRSMVNSREVSAAYDPADPLWQLLQLRLDKAGHVDLRADSIVSIAMTDPKFEGSRMCRTMEFTLSLSARDEGWVEVEFNGHIIVGWALGYFRRDGVWKKWGVTDWTPIDETRVVKLDVYGELKDMLALGLNSSDYEICTAEAGDGAFTLAMRRFGHGVGMSQRGAQTMAGEHGMQYIDILGFYYPGMTLEKIAWDETELPEMEALPDALASERILIPPMAGDLGELSDGEYYARVALESSRSRLNVRSEPSTNGNIVAKLTDGYRVAAGQTDDNGWAKVRGAGFYGYVKAEYLITE